LQVAGGLCNVNLGPTSLQISIAGCEWSQDIQQDEYEKLHQDLPAQLLNIEIIEIHHHTHIQEFFRGTNPIVRTIDLRDTEGEDALLTEELDERREFDGEDTGMANPTDEAFGEDAEGQEKAVDDVKESVRFQYNGNLKMDVTLRQTDEKKTCANPSTTELTDPTIGKSFHVVDYMKIFYMRLDLFYEIIPPRLTHPVHVGAICDMLDEETHQVEIINNVGLDRLSGFDTFYSQLTDTVQDALAVCSSIAPDANTPAQGACLESVRHNDDGRKAGLDFKFAAGRPYPFGPTYTKNINFKVIGGVSSVQHFAEFFIEGLFSKGSGNSFALPTHEPIMVLRDPPGTIILKRKL